MKLKYIELIPKTEVFKYKGHAVRGRNYKTNFGKWLDKQLLIVAALVYISFIPIKLTEVLINITIFILNHLIVRVGEL